MKSDQTKYRLRNKITKKLTMKNDDFSSLVSPDLEMVGRANDSKQIGGEGETGGKKIR